MPGYKADVRKVTKFFQSFQPTEIFLFSRVLITKPRNLLGICLNLSSAA